MHQYGLILENHREMIRVGPQTRLLSAWCPGSHRHSNDRTRHLPHIVEATSLLWFRGAIDPPISMAIPLGKKVPSHTILHAPTAASIDQGAQSGMVAIFESEAKVPSARRPHFTPDPSIDPHVRGWVGDRLGWHAQLRYQIRKSLSFLNMHAKMGTRHPGTTASPTPISET